MSRVQAIELVYLFCAVCFIVALKGLSSPRSARLGNIIGAVGMTVAVGATFATPGLHRIVLIIVALVVGTAVGVPAARAVKMTAVPQMVAAFNGVGGCVGLAGRIRSRPRFFRYGGGGAVQHVDRCGVVHRQRDHVREAAGVDDR
jgi:NAD(P) transhydrogenase subunit beta